jgi:hypothetical protein
MFRILQNLYGVKRISSVSSLGSSLCFLRCSFHRPLSSSTTHTKLLRLGTFFYPSPAIFGCWRLDPFRPINHNICMVHNRHSRLLRGRDVLVRQQALERCLSMTCCLSSASQGRCLLYLQHFSRRHIRRLTVKRILKRSMSRGTRNPPQRVSSHQVCISASILCSSIFLCNLSLEIFN